MRPSAAHLWRNRLHSALLLGGMALIAWVCATAIAGQSAGLWALVGVLAVMLITPVAPKELLLSLYGARRLTDRSFPFGAEATRALAKRAALPQAPALYYIASSAPNAFAVGGPADSAVAVSDGLLRLLDRRELAGVLAHEISHVANRDLWIMGLADAMSRATALMSQIGLLILFLNLPLALLGAVTIPWALPLTLFFAPTLMSLLQLALSRAREFDADRAAATLTGDPMGLASALAKLERRRGGFWEDILLPGRRIPDPSLLRSHPPTADRIERLRALAETSDAAPPIAPTPLGLPAELIRVQRPPRLRWTGLWH